MVERRGLPSNRVAGPPPVAEAVPVSLFPARLLSPLCAMSAPASAATAEELEASQQKKRRMKKHREQAEAAEASSEAPQPPATLESKLEPPVLVAPETLTSTAMAAAAAVRRVKERKSKSQEASPSASPLMEEPVRKEEKKRKRRKYGEAAAVIPSPSTTSAAQILEMESKVTAEGAPVRKKQRRRKVEREQSGQPPFPIDVHPQGEKKVAADGGIMGSQCVKSSSKKKPRVLSTREMLRMRVAELKGQPPPLPQGFFPPMANHNSTDQDSNHSSPFGAFFDQFRYKPERRQDRNAPPLPYTPDCPARPPPRGHLSSGSSLLTAKETSKAAKTTTSNTKQPCPASAATSCSQEKVRVKEKEKPKKVTKEKRVKEKEKPKKVTKEKKPRKPPPLLTAAEKRSDKYRRVPLDQLVAPLCSPYKLLQEKYASDPWKVIVICMLLNLTQGKQVRKIVEGFFNRYPDAQTAYTADPEMMAKYLAPLGLQHVKTKRIQKFSKAYVGEEWTYIAELCGVGKYAADAYAIFCAGRAKEVVPEDHKLVDYWKYVLSHP